MGVRNAPEIFQRLMDCVLQDMPCACCYIDDILIGSSGHTQEELISNHYNDLRKVMKRLEEQLLVAEMSKTGFFDTKVHFWGHVLQGGRTTPAKGKMMVMEGWPQPKVTNELRGFLQLYNFYSSYVPKYTELATPFMELLQTKDMKTVAQQRRSMMKFQLKSQARQAFMRLKRV